MKVLVFEFENEWIDAIEAQFENPVERLKRVVEAQGAKIMLSERHYFFARGEEEQRKSLIEAVVKYIVKKEWELNPFRYMKITGDVDGLEDYISGLKKELEKNQEREVGEMFKALEQRLAAQKKTNAEEDTGWSQYFKPMEEEVPAKRREKKDVNAIINQMCDRVPEKYSPVMEKYIRELGNVIPMLKKMGLKETIWSRNLLVSIDAGFGYTSFLWDIVEIFRESGLVDASDDNILVQEYVVRQKVRAEEKYEEWEQLVSRMYNIARENVQKKQRVIVSVDIHEWMSELQTEKISDYLRKISAYAKEVICVFKVPFVEASVLNKAAERLADVMPIQVLSIPNISMDCMVDFLLDRLAEAALEVKEKCLPYFEQWVMKERCDDSFYGYKSLEKMAQELIYKKALLNCEVGEVSYTITEADMQVFLEEPYKEEDPYALLNQLIGIATVKQYIKELVIQIKTQKEMADNGLSVERPCIHMMFTGNPGTGKTTVARILARILKEEGVLRKGLFFEVHGRSLCGNYIGHTAPKTSAYCRDAYGSVLFIDEAYSLYQEDSDRDFGREAIHTLIAEMENHRDDFCVILAGYKKQMHQMFHANPGLESRIPYEIEFPNYTKEELEEIFWAMLNGKFAYGETLKEAAHQFFGSLPEEVLANDNFSNARYVRNLFEKVWGKAAYRRNLEGNEQLTIEKVDFDGVVEMLGVDKNPDEKSKRRIGFSY